MLDENWLIYGIYIIIVSLDAYKIIVNQKKISCRTTDGNQLSSDANVDVRKCKKNCDYMPGCMFFLFRHDINDNSCHTFKTCDMNEQEHTRSFGVIYANSLGIRTY